MKTTQCQHLNKETEMITYWPSQEEVEQGSPDREYEIIICVDCKEQLDD